jgi:hypothetical protein
MMHQPVEDTRANAFITTIQQVASQLTTRQARYILEAVGDSHKDEFYVLCEGRIWGTNLEQEARLHPMSPLSIIWVVFEGGPTQHEKFKASLSTFVADRLLLAMRRLGKNVVCDLMAMCLEELEQGAPFDDNEKSEEWDDMACSERYAG